MTLGHGSAVQPAAAVPAYAATRLTLSDFRCYAGVRLDVDTRSVVLTGPNGAGKTNLLEALSLLSPGRGFRRPKLSEIARRNTSSHAWAVAARIDTQHGTIEIGTGIETSVGNEGAERRIVRIDGETAGGPQALAEVVSITWLTPQMDRLFVEAPSGRRRFLDRLTFGLDPGHARRVSAFEKAMRERNRLLKTGGADPIWLGALEDQMAEWGVAVAAARRDAVARLCAALEEQSEPFPRAHLVVAGSLEVLLDEMPAVAVEDHYRERLKDLRRLDTETGGATEGPHKSDLLARHVTKDMPAELCSTGEQKALLIATVLADVRLQAARRGIVPIVLLDEMAAHLDASRRDALFEVLRKLGAQVWMTGTDIALFENLRGQAQFFTIRDGRIFG